MTDTDPLARIQTRRHLEEINEYILGGKGEIRELPGKISLVWMDDRWDTQRYLAVKAAGDDGVLINGRPYPASETGLRQGLRACLSELK